MKEYFNQAGIELSSDQEKLFKQYLDLFIEWNKKVNISGIKDPKEIIIKHFVDSVMIVNYLDIAKFHRVLDVGTGGGLPGIPLAILYPETKFVLLDATRKKLEIIEDIISKLGLKNVKILWGRAEKLGHEREIHENFELVLARALAKLPQLLDWCLPFVRPKHYLVAYKGPSVGDEFKETKKIASNFNSTMERVERYDLPEGMGERLLLFYKKGHSSKKYQ